MTHALLGLAIGLAAAGAVAALLARRRRAAVGRELEETRRRLVSARDATTRFFDLTTHELRSPLSAILGYQELLADDAYGELPDEAHDAIDRLGRAARHLLNLIDGVMELNRLAAGEIRPDLGVVDLGVTFSAAVEVFRTNADDRGITTTVDLPEHLPSMPTDPHRLVRALDLLITSAIRHPAGDAMDLAVTVRDDEVAVAIGPTDIAFDPTIENDTARLGIRLAVAARVAELLGGALHTTIDDDRIRALTFRFRAVPVRAGL